MASTSVPPSVPPPATEVLRAEMQGEPDWWLKIVCWGVVAFSVVQVLLFSFGPEHGGIATVADGLLRGKTPYRDLWDPHPPGIFFTYAAAFALFGKNMAAPRLLEALCMIGVALSCRRLGGVFFANRTAGLLGGATANLILAQHEFLSTALPASFAGALTMIALVVVTHPWPRKSELWAWGIAGVLFGCVTILRPILLLGFFPAAAYLFFRRRTDGYSLKRQLLPVTALALGTALPVALTLSWFGLRGALDQLFFTLTEFAWLSARSAWTSHSAPHLLYEALLEALFQQSALLAGGLIAAAAVHPRASREKEGFLLLFSVACLQLVGVAFRATFEPQQFLASLPPLSLIAGVGFYKLWRRIGPGSWAGTLAFCSLLMVLPPMRGPDRALPESFWVRSRLRLTYLAGAGRLISREELDRRLDRTEHFQLPRLRSIARDLQRVVPPASPIWVRTQEPVLYWLSDRHPATRFLQDPTRQVAEIASVTNPLQAQDLKSTPPSAIVVSAEERTGGRYRLFDREYLLVSTHGDRKVYVRSTDQRLTTQKQGQGQGQKQGQSQTSATSLALIEQRAK